jgi:Dynamin family
MELPFDIISTTGSDCEAGLAHPSSPVQSMGANNAAAMPAEEPQPVPPGQASLSSDDLLSLMFAELTRVESVASTIIPRQLTVNIVGQQDAGKSATLNNLIGRKVCPEAHGVVTTKLPTLVVIDASNKDGDIATVTVRSAGGLEEFRPFNLNDTTQDLSKMVDEMQDLRLCRNLQSRIPQQHPVVEMKIWSVLSASPCLQLASPCSQLYVSICTNCCCAYVIA